MKNENEHGVAYLLIGLGLGLLAGLLWAPRRSQETRASIRTGAAAGLNILGSESARLRAETHRWLDTLRDRLSWRTNGGVKRDTSE